MNVSSPRARARRAARRELAAVTQHSPCVLEHRWEGAVAIILVDLPYLTRPHRGAPPGVEREFILHVQLPEDYPQGEPQVVFFSPHPVFHPAISAHAPIFCVGNVWAPAVGLGRFVILHIEAVLGLVEIETGDALFGDPVCAEAAEVYRELRERGRLPLERPILALRASDSEEKSDGQEARQVTDCPPASRPSPPRAQGPVAARRTTDSFSVRTPRGRRIVTRGEDGATSCAVVATRDLAAGANGSALAWIRDRLARTHELDGIELITTDDDVRLRRPPDAAHRDQLTESWRRVLYDLDPAIEALTRPSIADALVAALTHAATGRGEERHAY